MFNQKSIEGSEKRSGFVVSHLAFALLVVFASAGCSIQSPTKSVTTNESPNLGVLKSQYKAPEDRKQVEAQIQAVFAEASKYVLGRASAVAQPAIVLDIDETSVNNWKQLIANDFGYISNGEPGRGDCSYLPQGPCSSVTWDSLNQAPAEPGVVEFFNSVKAIRVSVFFITGRRERERDATVLQLNTVGFKNWDGLSLKPADMTADTTTYKSTERAKIESQGYTIIANIGDQNSDLANGHAERTFKIPNPYYFIP